MINESLRRVPQSFWHAGGVLLTARVAALCYATMVPSDLYFISCYLSAVVFTKEVRRLLVKRGVTHVHNVSLFKSPKICAINLDEQI